MYLLRHHRCPRKYLANISIYRQLISKHFLFIKKFSQHFLYIDHFRNIFCIQKIFLNIFVYRLPRVIIPERSEWIGTPGFLIATWFSRNYRRWIQAQVHVPYRNIKASYRIPYNCSVFQAEILAIIKAAEIIVWNIKAGCTQ